jgi:hypothetical protein
MPLQPSTSQSIFRHVLTSIHLGHGEDYLYVFKPGLTARTRPISVEIAGLPDGGAAVRDSKDPTGPVLAVPLAQWAAFVGAASRGEFG